MGFDLFLFTTDEVLARKAWEGGIDGFVVDWECRGKRERQQGANLEENGDTPEDLRRLKAAGAPRLLCRVNGWGPWSPPEVEAAVSAGADVVLLPMVRRVEQAEAFLASLGGRAAGGILVETVEAVERAADLARLPLDMAYLGLNDLALDRGTDLFRAITDGTVERVRRAFRDVPFGFAGLTVLGRGFPVPTRLLAAEMARLACDFTFLRRSFKADLSGLDVAAEVGRMRDCATRVRPPAEAGAQQSALLELLREAPVRLR